MISQLIRTTKQALAPYYPESEVQAMTNLLLEKRAGMSRVDVYLGKDIQFSPEQLQEWEDILLRLQRYEPIQYILKEADFDGRSFYVDARVLIPRPETAELVRWVDADCQGRKGLRLLDIGTGSGCIAISLAHRLPEAQVQAWDVSEGALAVARENNRRHGTSVEFVLQDVFAVANPLLQVDVLVSNPPYICEEEKKEMETNVLDWEPGLALFVPDQDPLKYYRKIAQLGCEILTCGGVLYFEINRAYGRETVELLESLGYQHVELRKDLSGNDRMVKGIYERD